MQFQGLCSYGCLCRLLDNLSGQHGLLWPKQVLLKLPKYVCMIYHDIHVDSSFAIFLLQYVFIISICIHIYRIESSIRTNLNFDLKHPVRLSFFFSSVRITAVAVPRLGDQRFAEAGDRAMRQILQVLDMTYRAFFPSGNTCCWHWHCLKTPCWTFWKRWCSFFWGGGDVLIVRSGEVIPFDDFVFNNYWGGPEGKTCFKSRRKGSNR